MEKEVKLSDYVVSYIADKGINDVFMIVGGGAMHLNEAFGSNPKVKYHCNHHEQASAIASEGYTRITGKPGVCVVTTGPGGTNTITGLVGQWLDSLPALYISGQVKIETTIGDSGLRQMGLQEIPIVDLVKSVTKYAVMVTNPQDIKYHLDKAFYLATTGRPGPVWIDIPLDIQASYIQPKKLRSFSPKELPKNLNSVKELKDKVKKTVELLKTSKRPLFIVGSGVRLSGAIDEFLKLAQKLNVPVVTATTAHDVIYSDHPLFFGRPGLFGERVGNFVVQNTDLLITIGSQLSIWTISFGYKNFARVAKHVRVDIDPKELKKRTVKHDLTICCDAKVFIKELNEQLKYKSLPKYDKWLDYCKNLRKKYPVVIDEQRNQKKFVNSYYFVEVLSDILSSKIPVVVGNGTAFTCTFQCMKIKKNQRLIGNVGCASMGYDLPAAIGVCIGNEKRETVLITGDGSIQMNIQELQTIVFKKLPIKIFLLNNNGYLAIRNTQDAFFKSHYVGTDETSGVGFPDMAKISKAYGIPFERIKNHKDLKNKIKKILSKKGPFLCELMMNPKQPLIPKVSSYARPDGKLISRPMEDMYPFLEREEFFKNMIIAPLKED